MTGGPEERNGTSVDLETTLGVSETIDGWMTRSELA